MSTGMHHVLVVRQVVCLCNDVGYYGRMLGQECLIINFLPFELFGQLRQRFNAVNYAFLCATFDGLA